MTDAIFNGINPSSLMSTAAALPQGQQKAKYSADVSAAMGNSLIVEIQVGATVKYRATVNAALSHSAEGIFLPTQFSEPPTINIADALIASTAHLVIKNAGNVGVEIRIPIKAGGANGYLTASSALNGTATVRTNGVILRPPATLDASGTGTSVPLTVDSMIAQMKVNDESPLYNSPTGNNWRFGGTITMGADWRFQSTPTWWPANNSLAQTANWTTFLPWFVVWDGNGHQDNLNCRVALKDMEFWLADTNWNWTLVHGPASVVGNAYRRDLQGETGGKDERTESDGSLSIRFNHSSTAVYHGWSNKINNINMSGVRGVHVRMKARKVVHTTSGTDQRNIASYLIHVGGDPYPTADSHVNNNNPDSNYLGITWLPGIGSSRFSYVTNDWTAFSFVTLNSAYALDNSARGTRLSTWTMTEQNLRDHPPPLNF